MKQYIDKAEVITEIESKIKEWRLGSSSEAKFRIEAYKELSEWLDTLEVKEEPVSEDLDEAAKKAATWHSRVRGDVFFHNDYQKFIEGAKWQKMQTIEKACAWLSNVCIEDMTYKYDDFDTSEGWYKFIEDFKQAMNK